MTGRPCVICWCVALASAGRSTCRVHATDPNVHPQELEPLCYSEGEYEEAVDLAHEEGVEDGRQQAEAERDI